MSESTVKPSVGPHGSPHQSLRGIVRLGKYLMAAALMQATLLACGVPPRPPMSAADIADINRITTYLNSIPQFEAQFVQDGSFGSASGVVRLDRPGERMRIDYSDSRVMVVANGQVQIVDPGNASTTTMPVDRTPLGMLLTPKVDLSGSITVLSLYRWPGALQIALSKTDHPSQGTLVLTLADPPLRLVAVTVVDPHERTLTMHFSRLNVSPVLNPGLFQPPTLPAEGDR